MFKNIVEGLLAPETAPMNIRIITNGVVLDLFKRTDDQGSIYYAGTPVSDRGRTCRYGLRMDHSGHITGMPAVAFIEAGGDTRTLKSGKELTPTFRDLASKIMSAVLMVRLGDEAALERGLDSLALAITEKLPRGVAAVRGGGDLSGALDEIFTGESDMLALLGVEAGVAKTMALYDLGYSIDYEAFASGIVSDKYAEVGDGVWDEESDLVADTARIAEAHKLVLRRGGKRLARIRKSTATA